MLLTGKEVKELRLKHNISQRQLSSSLQITNVYLSYIENDKVEATKTRIKIKEYFENIKLKQ